MPACAAPLYAQTSDGPFANGSLLGTAVALSEAFLITSAAGFSGGVVFGAPYTPTLPLGLLQFASLVGVQQLVYPRDPALPGPPWAVSPLQPSVPFLVAASTTPLYPSLPPLYRCFRAGPTNASAPGAYGFGTAPGCDVDVAWDQSTVVGYASTAWQPPFTTPLWLCQTVAHSPNMSSYYGWVPGYGACASTSVAAIIGFVAVPMSN